jgi:hypothetical protein
VLGIESGKGLFTMHCRVLVHAFAPSIGNLGLVWMEALALVVVYSLLPKVEVSNAPPAYALLKDPLCF